MYWSDLLRNSEIQIFSHETIYWIFRVITMLIIHCSLITNQPTWTGFSLYLSLLFSPTFKSTLVKIEPKDKSTFHFSVHRNRMTKTNEQTIEKFTIRLDHRQNFKMRLKSQKITKIVHLSNRTNELGQRTCINDNFSKSMTTWISFVSLFFILEKAIGGGGWLEFVFKCQKHALHLWAFKFPSIVFSLLTQFCYALPGSLSFYLCMSHHLIYENQSISLCYTVQNSILMFC